MWGQGNANIFDNSCEYLETNSNYGCDGNCIVEIDCAGECGGGATVDCMGECSGIYITDLECTITADDGTEEKIIIPCGMFPEDCTLYL